MCGVVFMPHHILTHCITHITLPSTMLNYLLFMNTVKLPFKNRYFQTLSCKNTVEGNVMYNDPRVAINFNDGLRGGRWLRKTSFSKWSARPMTTVHSTHETECQSRWEGGGGEEGNSDDDRGSYRLLLHNWHISFPQWLRRRWGIRLIRRESLRPSTSFGTTLLSTPTLLDWALLGDSGTWYV